MLAAAAAALGGAPEDRRDSATEVAYETAALAGAGVADGDPPRPRVNRGDIVGRDEDDVPSEHAGTDDERIRAVVPPRIQHLLDDSDSPAGGLDAEAVRVREPVIARRPPA
jgi:hypothetical protein